jgi:hypothetical protein
LLFLFEDRNGRKEEEELGRKGKRQREEAKNQLQERFTPLSIKS